MAKTDTGKKWYVGAMNDGLFVIDAPPRPSTDDIAEQPNVNVIVAMGTNRVAADLLVEEHNARLTSDAQQLVELRKALLGVRNGLGCWCKTPFVNISEERPHEPRCLAVNTALNPSYSQEEKETQ